MKFFVNSEIPLIDLPGNGGYELTPLHVDCTRNMLLHICSPPNQVLFLLEEPNSISGN